MIRYFSNIHIAGKILFHEIRYQLCDQQDGSSHDTYQDSHGAEKQDYQGDCLVEDPQRPTLQSGVTAQPPDERVDNLFMQE